MISVIVPVYNVEQYLKRCVDSLIEQTYSDFEIILVDDGSKDGSLQLCKELEKHDSRIRAFHKENGGLSSARNFGTAEAKGEWVTYVDSDDYVSQTYLEDMVNLINKYDADMAITRVELRSEAKADEVRGKRFDDFVTDKQGGFYEVYIGNKVGWSGCGKLLKTSYVLNTPFPDGFYEDSASAYRFIDQCKRIAIGDYENNYKYIRREGSITASALSEKHYNIFRVCENLEKYVCDNFPGKEYFSVLIYENAVLQLLNRIKMPWNSYSEIYKKYRKKFRKSLWSILGKKDVSKFSKIYLVLLSLSPRIFLCLSKIYSFMKRNRLDG